MCYWFRPGYRHIAKHSTFQLNLFRPSFEHFVYTVRPGFGHFLTGSFHSGIGLHYTCTFHAHEPISTSVTNGLGSKGSAAVAHRLWATSRGFNHYRIRSGCDLKCLVCVYSWFKNML